MNSTYHSVDFRYTHQELLDLFSLANKEDVDNGGRYDARSGAINVWSHHWTHPATHYDSEIMGTYYFNCVSHRLWQIETDEGFSLDDLLRELYTLEVKALGKGRYGSFQGWVF